MSVRAWKRIITLFVVVLIFSLLATSIVFAVNYNRVSKEYDQISSDENLIDLSDYSELDSDELKHFVTYLNNVDINKTLDYQQKYSHLFIDNDFVFEEATEQKVCYLTFDDGPDPTVTARVLDVLKEYNVKATFFVVYKDGKKERELYNRIVDEGHTIGVHTSSHNYSKIYSSVDNYLKDFNRCANQIERVTGVKPEIFRFPGGSINSYNLSLYHELIAEMIRRGYTYYDWNSASGDASKPYVSPKTIRDNVLNSSSNVKKKIILMHDGKGHSTTAEALPEIIEGLTKQGYEFRALDNSVSPICFGY